MHIFATLLKLLASTSFLIFAWKIGAWETAYGRTLFAGLCLSWLGDLLLIPDSKKTFLAGLVSFFLAHAAYAAAFYGLGIRPVWAFMAALFLVFAGFAVSFWLMPHVLRKDRPMAAPVVAYLLAISVMVSLAAGAAGLTGRWWILAGAILFYLSDLFVARDRFVAPGAANRFLGLPLYYAAQFVLAATAAPAAT